MRALHDTLTKFTNEYLIELVFHLMACFKGRNEKENRIQLILKGV